MGSEVQNITQIPVNIQAWLLPHFTEGSYQDMRRASVAFSSFPFAFNEESPDPYTASVKALVFSGIFVSFMFALVLLRAWIVFKYGSPFVMWSVNTLSCCSVSLCGVLALGYYPLMIAYSVRYVEWERSRPPDIPKTGRVGDLILEYDSYSLDIPAGIVRSRVVARYLLLAVQWTVKIAFLSIFFEFRHSCKKVHKIILHFITFVTASCILSTTGYIIAENIRILKLEKQLGYQHIHPDSGLPLVLTIPEYILAAMDLFIDLLIVFFTAIILRSLQLNRSQKIRSLIFISPGFITVIIAVARCAILYGMQAPQNQARREMLRDGWAAFEHDRSQILLRGGDRWAENYHRRVWALSLLTPLGTFMSVYVACLPAFRVLMRGWSEKEQRKAGRSAESGSFSAVDCDSSEVGSVKLKQKQKPRWSWWPVAGGKRRGRSLLGGFPSLLGASSEKASQSYSSNTSMSAALETVHFVSKSGEVTRSSSGEMHIPDLELGEFFAGSEAERRLTGMVHQEK